MPHRTLSTGVGMLPFDRNRQVKLSRLESFEGGFEVCAALKLMFV